MKDAHTQNTTSCGTTLMNATSALLLLLLPHTQNPLPHYPKSFKFLPQTLMDYYTKSDRGPGFSLGSRFPPQHPSVSEPSHYPLNHKHDLAECNATCSQHYNRRLTQTTVRYLSIGSVQKFKNGQLICGLPQVSKFRPLPVSHMGI